MHPSKLMSAAGLAAALAAASAPALAQPSPLPAPPAPAPAPPAPPEAGATQGPPPSPEPQPPQPSQAPPAQPPQAWPAQPPQAWPAQPPQAPPPAPWYRFTLADGRVVDAQWVGGDAHSYFVQTPAGVFSLARANVLGAVPLTASTPPAPAPPPQALPPPVAAAPPPPAPAAPPAEERPGRSKIAAGIGGFAFSYGLTVLIALARRDDDPDAELGLIPIAGPILWTASDDDKWGQDGWDWLGLLSSFLQAGIVIGFVKGLDDKPAAKRASTVTVAPVTGPGFGGVVLGGSF